MMPFRSLAALALLSLTTSAFAIQIVQTQNLSDDPGLKAGEFLRTGVTGMYAGFDTKLGVLDAVVVEATSQISAYVRETNPFPFPITFTPGFGIQTDFNFFFPGSVPFTQRYRNGGFRASQGTEETVPGSQFHLTQAQPYYDTFNFSNTFIFDSELSLFSAGFFIQDLSTFTTNDNRYGEASVSLVESQKVTFIYHSVPEGGSVLLLITAGFAGVLATHRYGRRSDHSARRTD